MFLTAFSSKACKASAPPADGYATRADFCKVFNDNVDRLYTLSLLLTADHEKAEQCFLASFEDCMSATSVFRDWIHSWAKRSVIRNAIRIVFASPDRLDIGPEEGAHSEAISGANRHVCAVTSLVPFERFIYVMSVLENNSDRECSLLLDCSVLQVRRAKERALQHVSQVSGVGTNLDITQTTNAYAP